MVTLVIEWQRLVDEQGRTCPRCAATESEIEKAAGMLREALAALGIAVRIEKSALDTAGFREDPLASNRIVVAGRPLVVWLDATVGRSACCDVCGDAECRTVTAGGRTYEAIPAELIVRAGVSAAAGLAPLKTVPCCGPAETPRSGPCCPEGTDRQPNASGDCSPAPREGTAGHSWSRTAVFILVILAAAGVAAYSFSRRSSARTTDTEELLQAPGSEDAPGPTAVGASAGKRPSGAAAASCGGTLDSLETLGKLAADREAVFILLAGENEEAARDAVGRVNAAVKMLSAKGKRVAAFTLGKEAAEYGRLARQFPVESLPCVIVAGRGCQVTMEKDNITEDNLVRAFIRASIPLSSCGPKSSSSGCPQ